MSPLGINKTDEDNGMHPQIPLASIILNSLEDVAIFGSLYIP